MKYRIGLSDVSLVAFRLLDCRHIFIVWQLKIFNACLAGVSTQEFLDELGQQLIAKTCEKHLKERAFRCLGGNLHEFLTTLDGVHDVLQGEVEPERASFVCTSDPAGHLDLLFATERPAIAFLLLGSLKAIANRFYHTDATISVMDDDEPGHYRLVTINILV